MSRVAALTNRGSKVMLPRPVPSSRARLYVTLEIALPDAASGTRMAMLVRDLPKGSALRCSFSVLGEALSTRA